MFAHLRASVWLLGLTFLLCCGLYPLVLWLVGQGLFPSHANGSLIEEAGKVRGSRLLAQPFSEPRYFRPRPSAVGYNAAASGGSNLAASNPKLRGRVAQQLGLIARYRDDGPRQGAPVGPDIEKWFARQTKEKKRNLTAEWAASNPTLASEWVNGSDLLKAYVTDWAKGHEDVRAAWKKDNADKSDPSPADLGPYFFASFARVNPGAFPGEVEETKDGKKVKVIRPVREGDEIRQVFFDTWLTENPEKIDPLTDLEQVPADLVTTSGSGLDPHITLRGARYQLGAVAEARAREMKLPVKDVRELIEKLLEKHRFRPLGFLGEPLVNVLELNRSMDAELKPAK
jgi:K+-transporting ATPase ATPase C chain